MNLCDIIRYKDNRNGGMKMKMKQINWTEAAKRGIYRQSHLCECGHAQLVHLCGCQIKNCRCSKYRPVAETKEDVK